MKRRKSPVEAQAVFILFSMAHRTDVDATLHQLFQPGDRHIAQLELAMILYGLVAQPSDFRGKRGIWFVDNTAALMALIRGRSSSGDLSRLFQLIHLCLFALGCTLYWEWIPSKSNWALWTLPVLAVVGVVQFL